SIRTFAFYLPQFHPIPENDAWWGKGFTEWTNTAKAKPMFRGHYQPHVPADLGFYDLRVPETRMAQAELARAHGIEGFCYYHYWFGGQRILERPFQEVLDSRQPDFPFCLCWANQSWSGIWHGAPNRILIEQTYPGPADHQAHFDALLPAFLDPRHARAEGKPIFLIYLPEDIPDSRRTLDFWRNMAAKAGLPGLHLVAVSGDANWNAAEAGYDAKMYRPLLPKREWVSPRNPLKWARNKIETRRGLPMIHRYEEWIETQMPPEEWQGEFYPCVTHAWDNTPRSGSNGIVLRDSTPELFRRFLRASFGRIRRGPMRNKIVFLKSWNEWAEGNHLEPDLKSGHAYLRVIREELDLQRAEAG
ncbi:MAG TPA: glycoside hydrolase family 99-like domain-containing protein, partial [Acetobacteraceae bacterium]|nr:glycoside hydrolase family 99-like domain-containing protein [Acetobacteraceae bacterium]